MREKKRTALVVDDEVLVRNFIREALEAHGFHVLDAANGEIGRRTLRQVREIELIVTDILMPDEDGLEFLREIGRTTVRNRPKVLAISGGGPFARPAPFLQIAEFLGADFTLEKPFSVDELNMALGAMGLIRRDSLSGSGVE
jgi:DNA-binding response OmpR family regulator